MRKSIWIFCLLATASAWGYQTGETSRANFGSTSQTEQAAQQAQPSSGGRTMSTYSQHYNWNKGVQTQTVQTSTAGKPPQTPPQVVTPTVAATVPAGKQAATGASTQKQAVATNNPKAQKEDKQANAAPKQTQAQDPAAQAQALAAQMAAMQTASSDPAAMMQQVQQMMGAAGMPNVALPTAGTNNPAAGMPSIPTAGGTKK